MVSDHKTLEEEATIQAYPEFVRSALSNFRRIVISYLAAFEVAHISGGQHCRPLLETADAKRGFAMNEWELLPTRAGVSLSFRTVRTKAHKLTVDLQSGAGELYDLETTPVKCGTSSMPIRPVMSRRS